MCNKKEQTMIDHRTRTIANDLSLVLKVCWHNVHHLFRHNISSIEKVSNNDLITTKCQKIEKGR